MLLHIQCVRNTPTLHVLYHTYNTIRLHTLCCTCFSIRTKKYKLLEIHQTVHAVQYMPSYTYHTAHNILIVLTIRSSLHIVHYTYYVSLYQTVCTILDNVTMRTLYCIPHTIQYTPYWSRHTILRMLHCTIRLHHTALLTYQITHIAHYIYTSLCYHSILCVAEYALLLHTLLSWYTTHEVHFAYYTALHILHFACDALRTRLLILDQTCYTVLYILYYTQFTLQAIFYVL